MVRAASGVSGETSRILGSVLNVTGPGERGFFWEKRKIKTNYAIFMMGSFFGMIFYQLAEVITEDHYYSMVISLVLISGIGVLSFRKEAEKKETTDELYDILHDEYASDDEQDRTERQLREKMLDGGL